MAAPYRTKSGDLADCEGRPIRAYRGRGLEKIEALGPPLTADQVLKAVSAHALGLLHFNKEQLGALYRLGEAHRLWGARSEGVKGAKSRPQAPGVEDSGVGPGGGD